MKLYSDCIACLMRQALETSKIATKNEAKRKEALRQVVLKLSKISFDRAPADINLQLHRVVREVTGNDNPYSELKDKYNKMAMRMYPNLKRKVAESEDKLLTATRLAIAGNVIDFAPGKKFDLKKSVDDALTRDFAVNHFDKLRSTLDGSETVYYLGDNAGEVVFDRILLEELGGKEIIYIVKGGPFLNDATTEDAKFAGIDRIAEIRKVSNGVPGTGPEINSGEFIGQMRNADLTISKGQGNYEFLSEMKANIFFMMRAKCSIIARDLGVTVDDIVIKGSF